MRTLLESGAFVDSPDLDGRSFLFIGARQCDLDLVTTLLLDREAAVNQAKDGGGTPQFIAAQVATYLL